MKKYTVHLDEKQRVQLESILTGGKESARNQVHARILLKADQGVQRPAWTDELIAEALCVGRATVERVRRRFVEGGLLDALVRRPQPERPAQRKMDGDLEAHLVTLACSQAEGGQKRWTMRLLADKLVQLGYVDQISHQTVWVTLKKNELKPWLKKQFCIPPEANADFVYHMEDVLEVYQRPYDPRFPKLCMDERSKQLLAHTRQPIEMEAGEAERVDYEYERKGVCSIFVAMEPETGACQVGHGHFCRRLFLGRDEALRLETAKQQANHRDLDERFAGLDLALIVLAQATRTGEPAKSGQQPSCLDNMIADTGLGLPGLSLVFPAIFGLMTFVMSLIELQLGRLAAHFIPSAPIS